MKPPSGRGECLNPQPPESDSLSRADAITKTRDFTPGSDSLLGASDNAPDCLRVVTAPSLRIGLSNGRESVRLACGKLACGGWHHLSRRDLEPPGRDSMIGMFRAVKDGTAGFYELMAIEREGDGIVLRMLHFGPSSRPMRATDAP
ncbi:DUF6265 family protein [Stigmatella aurantiaca]|uniref:DUF6265 family protein n=1 Tax=Stigmatella aurantiaca TaxID=41 RepID=UPI002FC3C129